MAFMIGFVLLLRNKLMTGLYGAFSGVFAKWDRCLVFVKSVASGWVALGIFFSVTGQFHRKEY